MVDCPICSQPIRERDINAHLDSLCKLHIIIPTSQSSNNTPVDNKVGNSSGAVSDFFTPLSARRTAPASSTNSPKALLSNSQTENSTFHTSRKRGFEQSGPDYMRSSQPDGPNGNSEQSQPSSNAVERMKDRGAGTSTAALTSFSTPTEPATKKHRVGDNRSAPLAERMRPQTLDEVCGQDLVGKGGILRGLIAKGRVPSMVLWGPPGTGKTTISRLVAAESGMRFVEINSTSAGVAECKKIFMAAKNELTLTGRKTLLFCDEIHRFSKTQQDVFLGPVEAGHVTLIGATTENPSFKVINALLSRCRVFTLSKLTDEGIKKILLHALAMDPLAQENVSGQALLSQAVSPDGINNPKDEDNSHNPELLSPSLITDDLLSYIAAFANGDARMSLNLLELAISLDRQSGVTAESIKKSLTQTLLYDRAGDGHYDTISALHKSIRGSDPDGALFYLARMLTAGEDPLFIARRMIVMASEDIGLADNSLLPLTIATHSAVEKVGLPEARINLAHAAVALALAPKSTRAYRGYAEAAAAIEGVMSARIDPENGRKSKGGGNWMDGNEKTNATGGQNSSNIMNPSALDVPLHLRQGVTGLMKDLGYGDGYKYNPDYKDGKVKQEYLPVAFRGRKFLGALDLGTQIDPDLDERNGGEYGFR